MNTQRRCGGMSQITHYDDVIMSEIASQITSLTIVYSIAHSGADQSKHQSSASLAFVWEIHRGPVNFPHKWPVTRKMFPFDDVIMQKIDWIPLCLAMWNIVIDRMQLRQNRTRCLNITYFSYSHPMHFSTKKSANLTKRHAIAVKLLLVLNDAHNPINNPTVQITDPRKPNTLLPGNSTTDRISVPSHTTMEIYVLITMRHHFSNKFLEELWKEPCFARFDKYSTFDFTALCSNASAVSVNTWTWKPYFKITCVKSVLWPALINNVVNV